MQQIDRPVFRLLAVVPKRTRDLELNRPFVGNQEIRSSLGTHSGVIRGESVEAQCDEFYELRFAIRTDSGLK
jgi:hypothetical protein